MYTKRKPKYLEPLNTHLNKLLNNVYKKNDNGVFIKVIKNWQEVAPKSWQDYVVPIDLKWQSNKANLIVRVTNKSMSGLLFHEKDFVLKKLNEVFLDSCFFDKITML